MYTLKYGWTHYVDYTTTSNDVCSSILLLTVFLTSSLVSLIAFWLAYISTQNWPFCIILDFYDSINIRNSFQKRNPQIFYSFGELVSENNSAILIILISRWQLLSSRSQIRRGHVTAKHVCLCFTKLTRFAMLSSCEIYECLRKKKDRVPFLRQSQDQRKGRKHLALKREQTSLRATKVLDWFCCSLLQEIEEHERKPDTSEKQPDFAGIFTDLDRERCFFYCVIWNCFL